MLQLPFVLNERLDMCRVSLLEERSFTAKVEEDAALTQS
jgi:hypothetical protein